MAHECIFNAKEHKPPELDIDNDLYPTFNDDMHKNYLQNQKKRINYNYKYLAIRKEDIYNEETNEYENTNLKAHYHIGYRWYQQNKTYVHVSQKVDANGDKADYMQMFLACLKDPDVSNSILKSNDKLYEVFFDEPFIEVDNPQDEITPFLILHFLHLVKKITKKGLKKGYVKITENLTSKIKGKILINQTIKQNHFKNRLDKTVCNYQVFTINCIENQIIKTALSQCARHLHGISDKKESIKMMLRQNIDTFNSVEQIEVFNSDFSSIKHSPFYKDYKEALELSRMIFKRFGFALNNSNTKDNVSKIPPYFIDMTKLFERYVEVKLREVYSDAIEDGNKLTNIAFQMRPDFLLKKGQLIIDAKYKYWYGNTNENSKYKDDYMQLSLYGRENKIREIIGMNENDDVAELLFIYPRLSGEVDRRISFESQNRKYSKKFTNISIMPIDIPKKEDKLI